MLVAASALRERIVERLRRGRRAGRDVRDLLWIKRRVGVGDNAVVAAAAPFCFHLDLAAQLVLDRRNVLTRQHETVLRALVVHRLLAEHLAHILQLPVDVSVHLQHLLVVVGVRLEQRDLAVLLRELLLAIQLIARDRHILAARARRYSRSSRIRAPSAAQQIAEQSKPNASRADDTGRQRRICLAIACIFHSSTSDKK